MFINYVNLIKAKSAVILIDKEEIKNRNSTLQKSARDLQLK